VLVDPDAKQAVKVQAAKAIGAMTSVSLFTHRVETKIIKSSGDAREELMAQIREITKASAEDAHIIDADADSLMAELAESAEDDTHRPPAPQAGEEESLAYMHTIPHEQTSIPHEQSFSEHDIDPENPDGETPPPRNEDTPPSSFKT
jgi:NAD(P)H-hydrate repair Nnr-like enzyme with NAD(P)H-hydrate dehydratase domain